MINIHTNVYLLINKLMCASCIVFFKNCHINCIILHLCLMEVSVLRQKHVTLGKKLEIKTLFSKRNFATTFPNPLFLKTVNLQNQNQTSTKLFKQLPENIFPSGVTNIQHTIRAKPLQENTSTRGKKKKSLEKESEEIKWITSKFQML